MRLLLLAFALIGQAQPGSQSAQPAPPPPTDIYLVPLTGGLASMRAGKPVPVSTAPGYDNQPMFSPDGSRILFAANHDGKQTDVYAFDRASGRVSQLTQTPENENSATFLPAGLGDAGGFSVVQSELPAAPGAERVQRLWRFNARGGSPQLILTDIKPVGYYAWIDADKVALFILGQPNTLQLASVKTGKAEILTKAIGRSVHRVPGTRRVSFVQREGESGPYLIKEIDIDSRKVDTLATFCRGELRPGLHVDARRQDAPHVLRHEGVFLDPRCAGAHGRLRRRRSRARRRVPVGGVAEG
jgi:hypothetical protein